MSDEEMTLLVNPQVPLSCSGCCCFCSSMKQQDFLLSWKTTRIPPPSPVLVLLPHTFPLINHHQGNSQTYCGKLHEFLFPLQCLFFFHTLSPHQSSSWKQPDLSWKTIQIPPPSPVLFLLPYPFPSSIIIMETARLIVDNHNNFSSLSSAYSSSTLFSPHQSSSSSWERSDLSWKTTRIPPPSAVLILPPYSFP